MPNWIPNYDVALAQMNSGERKVARQLQELLPPEVYIIANYRWQVIKNDKAPVDLETDFVIVWPLRGVVILEVKGGLVDWDPRVGTWLGLVSRSPTEQARGSRHGLVDKLARITYPHEDGKVWRDRVQAFPLFPDVDRDKFPSSMDGFERDCILGLKELRNISNVLQERTKSTVGRCANLTGERCHRLVQKLCPEVHLKPTASHIIEDESKMIEWATERQLRLVENLRDVPCVFVSGSAGTGKTIMGLTALKTWAASGHNAFFVTVNPHLAQFLRDQHSEQASLIYSLAGFLRDIVKCETPVGDPLAEDDLLDILSQPEIGSQLDGMSLVLDEAQDLSRDALGGLLTLCKYRNLWVLYDDQQVLEKGDRIEEFEARVRSMTGREQFPVRLNYNLRNTQRIGEYVSEWVQTDYAPSDDLPVGEPPSINYVVDDCAHDQALKDLLGELFNEQKYRAADVVLVSCLSSSEAQRKYTSSEGYTQFGRKMRYLGGEASPGVVRVASVLDFKGQEASVVVLADTRNATALNAFYIGGSRAKLRLYVIAYKKPVERPSTNFVASMEAAGYRI
jgi:Uncharacterized conserved protein (DUF2075)/Nuclease-related domain